MKPALRRLLAMTAAGVLAAVLPAGLAVAHGPRAAQSGATAGAGAGATPGAGAGAAPGRAAGSVDGRPGFTWRPALTGPAFRGIRLAGGRGYQLHLPPERVARSTPPVVIVLHGLNNGWQGMEQTGQWSRYADAHGFVVAYGIGRGASWNAGACCGAAHRARTDDVAYLVSVVADLATRYDIDRGRVYVVGFSNGDMMAIRAECDRPDVFAAAGGAAGGLVGSCRAAAGLIRVRHLHGRHDAAVPYRGGYSPYTGTSFRPVTALPRLLAAGSPRPVVAMTALDCGHLWPRWDNACHADGTDLIWRWISQFRRSAATPRQPGDRRTVPVR